MYAVKKTVKNLRLPLHTVDIYQLKENWTHLSAVDVSSMMNVQLKILIGQDNCQLIIPREVIEGPPNAPVLSRSLLGWSVHRNVGALKNRMNDNIMLHTWECKCDDKLHNLVKQSFKTESFRVLPPVKKLLSHEEERARKIMENTTKGVDDRWETGLLWRHDDPNLPLSYVMTKQRLYTIEKQMRKDEALIPCTKKKLRSSEISSNPKTWYIPHFPVYNVNKPRKIRLVFDAAARSGGSSLNNMLLPGPDML